MAKVKNTDSILTKIENYITRFVVLPHEHQSMVLSTWVLHTWAFDAARTTPYMYVHSPEKQSGKSLLLDVLSSIMEEPMATIDATGPVIFRAIEELRPTLLFDEVDAIWSGAKNDGLRGVLNGGYKIGGKVYRLRGGEVGTYNTFCPKLLAGIHNGYLPDTLVDRCIPITMRRKQVGVGVEPFMPHKIEEEIAQLSDEIGEWADEHMENLVEYEQHPVEGLSDRGAEIAWPLLAIANEFGMRDELAEAIVHMVDEYHELTDETDRMLELIREIAQAFEEVGRDRIHTEELLPMLEMDSGTAAAMELSAYLDKYEIGPYRMRIRRSGKNLNRNGYSLDQFEELFGMHNIEVNLDGK
jgi:hypothetical protein